MFLTDIGICPRTFFTPSFQVEYDKKVLAKFCGQENSADGHHPGNRPLLSPSNRLTLVLQTDDTNPEPHQHLGFSAHYQAKGSNPTRGLDALLTTLIHNPRQPYNTVKPQTPGKSQGR